MNAQQLRAVQAPLKEKYRSDPDSALVAFKAQAELNPDDIACRVQTPGGPIESALHPAAGGARPSACSGDMLLEALVACASVTLRAVATAMDIPIRGGTVSAEAAADFRGTLGVARDVPIGIQQIRLSFQLETDADDAQLARLVELTERYCIVLQTLKHPPEVEVTRSVR